MMVRGANLALKFLLELAAVAALAYWGTSIDGGVVGVLIGTAAVATTIGM
jgi:hypothetical protein